MMNSIDKEYLTTEEVSKLIGISRQTLHNHRSKKKGIPFIRVFNRTIRHKKVDVQQYMDSNAIDMNL